MQKKYCEFYKVKKKTVIFSSCGKIFCVIIIKDHLFQNIYSSITIIIMVI